MREANGRIQVCSVLFGMLLFPLACTSGGSNKGGNGGSGSGGDGNGGDNGDNGGSGGEASGSGGKATGGTKGSGGTGGLGSGGASTGGSATGGALATGGTGSGGMRTGGAGGGTGGAGTGGVGTGGARTGGIGGFNFGGFGGGAFIVYTGWPFDAAEAARRQAETATKIKLAREIDLDLGGGVKLTMVLIPAGQSRLGCTDAPFPGITNAGDRCEGDEPLHNYTQAKPVYIGKTVVTVAHFNALAPSLPDSQTLLPGLPGLPAKLPYRRAQDIIRPAVQARAPNGWTIRLPAVDEWEHAARAGVVTYFSTGNTEADLAAMAWYRGNSGNMMHEVGLKAPNAWNLHDVIGNAWSWIWLPGSGYGDLDPTNHLVRSCPFDGGPLWNDCRLSNRQISDKPQEFRFAADVPLP